VSPIYEITCPKCKYKEEVLLGINAPVPPCLFCDIPMNKGSGSIAFYRMKGDIQGTTPGTRKYAREITSRRST